MRKALKIILPLVLAAVLLIAAYWFFFQYRKDITANLCVSIGDGQRSAGKYEQAITWYGYANTLQPDNAQIALKLSDAYRDSGNYTKTEYVLVNAIYASPDCTDLYVALCRAYIEQDKLMDAQRMLDQIRNEAVLAELNARRPAAPTVTPEGGYYSDRITVSLQPVEGADCYLALGGDFPSVETDLYSEPLSLPIGESTVCAVSVGADGLVSPAVYVGYTVAGVVEDAVFADEAFEHYVQELLRRGNRSLKTNDLWSVTKLDIPEDVLSFEDLRYFTGLTELTIHDAHDADLSPLTGLSKLRSLDLSGCNLTTEQLTAVGGCANLTELRLAGCGLSSIKPLESLTQLTLLDLSDNSISNLTPISECRTLQTLLLGTNALTSLGSLSKLTELQVLDLSRNVLKSLAPLSGCTQMRELNVSHNQLISLTGMDQMAELEVLDASNNEVTDVSVLAVCTKLRIFTMTDNLLTSIDFLNGNKTIEEISIDYNDVTAVPDLPTDCALVRFSAAHNFLEDLSGLAGISTLNYVNADYNNITDIDVLRSCENLTQVNVFGTYIHDGGVLEELGVTVNYTPIV